jgi:hypothetical protein
MGMLIMNKLHGLRMELQTIDTLTPIVISTHIPFITTFSQLKPARKRKMKGDW